MKIKLYKIESREERIFEKINDPLEGEKFVRSKRNLDKRPHIFMDKNRGSSNYISKPRNATRHCPFEEVEGAEINWKRGVKRRGKLVTRQSTFE